MINEVKQEASLPVQGRIDIRTLANLAMYWEINGVNIESMSQLLSWSVELAQHLLSLDGALPFVTDSVAEANGILMERGLYKPGTRKRGQAKAFQAMVFESLRSHGTNPSIHMKPQYNTLHNVRSVKTPEYSDPVASTKIITDDMWENAQKRIREEEEKEKKVRGPDTSPIVKVESLRSGNEEEIDAMLNEAKRRAAESEEGQELEKKSDVPRAATKEELDARALELEREERAQLERFKNM